MPLAATKAPPARQPKCHLDPQQHWVRNPTSITSTVYGKCIQCQGWWKRGWRSSQGHIFKGLFSRWWSLVAESMSSTLNSPATLGKLLGLLRLHQRDSVLMRRLMLPIHLSTVRTQWEYACKAFRCHYITIQRGLQAKENNWSVVTWSN